MKITVITTLATAITLAIVVGLILIYDGVFNVSTVWKDPDLVRWAMVTTRENSIRKRAAQIVAPPTQGQQQIDTGFRSYREMCALCHTPPGAIASPVAKGLNPEPADLEKSAKNMSIAELFWVIKNGIRMTGMPAWGPTHSDEEIWDIVAFVKKLPKMNDDDYLSMDERLEKGHSHKNGGHNEM